MSADWHTTQPAVKYVACAGVVVLLTADPMAQSGASSTAIPEPLRKLRRTPLRAGQFGCVSGDEHQGGERLLTARGKAFVAAFDEVAAPRCDCSPATYPQDPPAKRRN